MRKIIIVFLCGLPAVALGSEWGLLKDGAMPEVNAAGPAHHSRTFIAEAPIRNGRAQIDLPLDTPRNATLVVFGDAPLTARSKHGPALQSKAFREPALAKMDVPSVGTRVDVSALMPGERQLQIDLPRRDGMLRYAVAQPESPLALRLQVRPLAAHGGDTVTIRADLSSAPTGPATVAARIRGVGQLELRDDGRDADRRAGDRVYTGRFTAPETQGLKPLQLQVQARGRLAGGTAFRRTGGAAVMVSPRAARLESLQARSDSLEIALQGLPGHYRVEAIYGQGEQALVWAREDIALTAGDGHSGPIAKDAAVRQMKRSGGNTPAGHTLSLPRPPAAFAADRVVVRLLNRDTLALEAERAIAIRPLAAEPPALKAPAPALPASKRRAAEAIAGSGK